MSAITAVLQRRLQPAEPVALQAMIDAAPHRSVDGHDLWANGCIALGHQRFDLTPEGQGEIQPCHDPFGQYTITCDVRLDNRTELQRRLNWQPTSPAPATDTELILAAYKKWKAACVDYLLGDFAFAIWDDTEQQLFVARDPLGARDVAYYLDSDVCVVASEVKQVVAHPHVPRRINDLKIAMVLVSWWHNHDQTCFENVFYLPPAHAMLVSAETVRIWRYWDIDPGHKIRYRTDQEYADHFLALLQQSLADRLRVTGSVGVSMSGGIDSTTLAVLAAEQLSRERLKTFSYVFDRYPSCDERNYIQPVVDQYELDATFIPGDDLWPLSDVATWPIFDDFPSQDPYVRLPQAITQVAQASGVKLLLNGHYGDLLLVGGRYWVADMLRDPRCWRALAQLIGHERDAISLRRDVWQNGVRQLLPPPVQQYYRVRRSPMRQVYHDHLHADLIGRTGLKQHLDSFSGRPAFATAAQLARYNHIFLATEAQGISATEILYNRCGIEVVDPFFERRLIEFCIALPADQLTRPPHTKWLLRLAMTNRLPSQVCWRRDKTSLLPQFTDALQKFERSAVQDLLRQPRAVMEKYVSADWIMRELQVGAKWHNYGHPLWLCLALEMWLRHQH